MLYLLAQDLTINPAQVAQELAKAESVQQVLSVVVGVLLVALVALVLHYVKRQKSREVDSKASMLAATKAADASNTREDALRTHYEQRLDAERAEQKLILREFNETLKGYAEE